MVSGMKPVFIFGEHLIDTKAIQQIKNCYGENDIAVLTADAHYGYGHPIGGAVAYKNHISLSGVGFDIGCGNKAVRTDILAKDLNAKAVMDEVFRRISFGIGRANNEPVEHPIIGKIAAANVSYQRGMVKLAENQLGTVGSGNHFVDLLEDDDGFVWIGVHFGSRGFGHKTTMGFIALSKNKEFGDKAGEGSMDAPPILFADDSEIGRAYIEAMQLAGEYAYAGRDIVVDKVLEILDKPNVTEVVHNHHNFAWRESHFGQEYWVVRKGCTPAFPGQMGFIGASMAGMSVVVEGVDSEDSRNGLYSTVHGAGRTMSRRQATGKTKRRKVWKCQNWHECDGELPIQTKIGEDGSNPKCPKCGHKTSRKEINEIISHGAVDFELVKKQMNENQIELRGAGADEAPECYKNLADVLDAQGETIRIRYCLLPIGVAMAGKETFDPYKD